MSKLQVTVGSTRQTPAADCVVPGFRPGHHAVAHPDVEVVDLRDLPLPMFQGALRHDRRLRLAHRLGPDRQQWDHKIRGDVPMIPPIEACPGARLPPLRVVLRRDRCAVYP